MSKLCHYEIQFADGRRLQAAGAVTMQFDSPEKARQSCRMPWIAEKKPIIIRVTYTEEPFDLHP